MRTHFLIAVALALTAGCDIAQVGGLSIDNTPSNESSGPGDEGQPDTQAEPSLPPTGPGPDVTAPSPPSALAVSDVTKTALTLAWAPSTDDTQVAGYRVYRAGQLVQTTSGLEHRFIGLACDTTYVLGVEAYDAANNVSERSLFQSKTAGCSAPVPGTVLEFSGTVTASALMAQINGSPAGPVTVRPQAGAASFNVSGSLTVNRANVTIIGAHLTGTITMNSNADGSSFRDGAAQGFYIFGAEDVTLKGNNFDGKGIVSQNLIWDRPAGSPARRYRIQNNVLKNFYDAADPSVHSEAIYNGYAIDGLIEGNTFDNNGTTAHIFFTWWGDAANPKTSNPDNVCVRNNTFGPTHKAYYDINIREETPTSNISVEVGQKASSSRAALLKPCVNPLPSDP